MTTHKPINLGVNDLLETRNSRFHGRWSADPVTTERLNRVINSEPCTPSKGSLYRSYAVLIGLVLLAVFGTLFVVAVVAR